MAPELLLDGMGNQIPSLLEIRVNRAAKRFFRFRGGHHPSFPG
jgi:hypothetical protein